MNTTAALIEMAEQDQENRGYKHILFCAEEHFKRVMKEVKS